VSQDHSGTLSRPHRDSMVGISDNERGVMERLLRMPREQQKAAPKPNSPQAAAQRRRRQKEKEAAAMASNDVP
jgi:hypothetical protein